MSQHQATVFVLWADNFDEVAAAIFVTELRKAGLRVKIVGLTPRHLSGAYGLTLAPDLTLDQALSLAEQVICVVVPQTLPGIRSLSYDPRLKQLFSLVSGNQGQLVIGPLCGVDIHNLELFPDVAVEKALVYPGNKEVMEFAHNLVTKLLKI